MPKVVSRSAVSSSTNAQPTASSLAALRVYYCICGEFILVIDKSLAALPRRRTDDSIIIRSRDDGEARARVFKLNAVAEDPILLERPAGHEKQYRFHCPRCSLKIGYQSSPPPVKAAPFLYIFPGALTQIQGIQNASIPKQKKEVKGSDTVVEVKTHDNAFDENASSYSVNTRHELHDDEEQKGNKDPHGVDGLLFVGRQLPADLFPVPRALLTVLLHIASQRMALPSARELELEVLLRERESQLTELKDEIVSLRRYLSRDPGPSTTEPVTLPPALMSVLLPHIDAARKDMVTSVSATVAGGLNQRMRQLQQENDELYNVLKASETGKLKDEVRSLRRAVAKLEGALKESHQVISSLSQELEKTHEALRNSSRPKGSIQGYSRPYSKSPKTPYRSELPPINSSNSTRPPPTGPRAYKRPRLSEPHSSPPPRIVAPLPPKPQTQNQTHHSHTSQHHPPVGPMRDQGRPSGNGSSENARIRATCINAPSSNHNPQMEVDGVESSSKPTSPASVRERERARERERNNKERERRDRESREINSSNPAIVPSKPLASNPPVRRNGSYSNASGRGSGGGGGRKVSISSNSHASDNRTLQERMGL